MLSFAKGKKVLAGEKSQDAYPDSPWEIMVIDDDESVHQVTHLILKNLTFEERGVRLIDGFSGKEAKELLQQYPDTAVVLLDVVMESDRAGLDVVEYLRGILANKAVRVILRTGQPGNTFAEKIINDYDINDFKEKSDLTAGELQSTVISALDAYNKLQN